MQYLTIESNHKQVFLVDTTDTWPIARKFYLKTNLYDFSFPGASVASLWLELLQFDINCRLAGNIMFFCWDLVKSVGC